MIYNMRLKFKFGCKIDLVAPVVIKLFFFKDTKIQPTPVKLEGL